MIRGNSVARIVLACRSAYRGGQRSVLAAGTVSVGTAAMMVTLALGTGARTELEAMTAQAERDLLTITPGTLRALPGRGRSSFAATTLSERDAIDLATQVKSIRDVVPIVEGVRRVVLGRRSIVSSIRGVNERYFGLRSLVLESGRLTDDLDAATGSRVAVVGALIAARLRRESSLVGETLRIGGVPFEVIGQLRPKGVSSDGGNEDDQILVPVGTAARRLFNTDYLSALLVQMVDRQGKDGTSRAMRQILRENHKLGATAADDFEILSPIRANNSGDEQSAFMQRVAGVVTIVTLLIGVGGVLTVMHLNVVDRTWEVGLRMAIGARRRDIGAMFVVEACCLAVSGGAVGALAGAAVITTLGRSIAWPMAIDLETIAVPLLAPLVLGVGAGAWPAWRAARLTPVDSLGSK
jgi:putative ABC transport system permease protein